MGAEKDDGEPMSEGIDGKDDNLFLENIHSSSPSFEGFVSLTHFLFDCSYEPAPLSLISVLVLHVLSNQLLHKERGVKIALVLQVRGQEHEVQHFYVVADYGVVQVGFRPQLVEVFGGYGKGLRFVALFVFEGELVARQL